MTSEGSDASDRLLSVADDAIEAGSHKKNLSNVNSVQTAMDYTEPIPQ